MVPVTWGKAACALLDLEPDGTRRTAPADSLLYVLGGRIARDRVSE
ncbi:hypothetical protein [Lentzea sp. NPDC060358]